MTAPRQAPAPNIAVIGPGAAAEATDVETAEEVGALLAGAGCVVITGGGGGVMAAAADGARRAGGTVIALLPGADPATASGSPTVVLPTGLGELRNGLIVRSAEAVIAVGGSWGTASEIALAMRTGTPVVSLGGWQFIDATGSEVTPPRAPDPAAAVELVLAALAQRGR